MPAKIALPLYSPPINRTFHDNAQINVDRARAAIEELKARRVAALKAGADDAALDALDAEGRLCDRALERTTEKLAAAAEELKRLEALAKAREPVWFEKYPAYCALAHAYVALLDQALKKQLELIRAASDFHVMFENSSDYAPGANCDVLSPEFVAGVKRDIEAGLESYARYQKAMADAPEVAR